MRSRFVRLLSMVGVALATCMPALVSAEVAKDVAAPAPAVIVKAKKVAANPGVEIKAEVKVKGKTVTKKTRIIAPAPIVVIGGDLNGNAIGMVQQWTMQFRPILRVEYLFVRVVCDPGKEQRLPIARAGLKALEEAAKKYVDWQQNQNRIVNGRLVERPAIPDTRKFIQDAIAGAVKDNLPPSQRERYRVEIEARSAELKRVALLNLVAKLDQALVLSAEQRDKIKESLSSHWNENWAQGFQSFNLDDQYLPMVPDPLLSPFLNEDQKKVWTGTQKITFNSNGLGAGMDMNIQAPLDEAFSDEDALKDDPKPETKD